jgi:hypothetical protein
MRLAGLLAIISASGLAGLLHAEEPAVATARTLARDGLAAFENKDYPAFLAKMEAAVALRPDYPRLLVNLAAAQVATGQPEAAVSTLERLAALGVHSPVDKSDDFAALRDRADFKAVYAKIAANLVATGPGEIAFTLPGMTGLVDGIAFREKTGEYFFGDVHLRCVWVRTTDGQVRKFTESENEVFGIFGLMVDEASGALWAATSVLPAMQGYTQALDGAAGVAEFDLNSGKLRRMVRLPADTKQHVLGDITMAPDGSLFMPDSGEGILWRLGPGAVTPEVFVESPEFMSLQGIVLTADHRTAILSDYANGLLRLDLTTRSLSHLSTPPDVTLLGIDGLALAPDGSVLAIQNGVRPKRILRLVLDASAEAVTEATVLESAHPGMADPTLGCIVGGKFIFVGNAGWSRFEDPEIKPTDPRPVPIFTTKWVEPPPPPKKPPGR